MLFDDRDPFCGHCRLKTNPSPLKFLAVEREKSKTFPLRTLDKVGPALDKLDDATLVLLAFSMAK